MNLQYYYNFVTIVEEGSLTAASRKLHVAQPALSNQIKAMEQKYGARLFFRGSRKLELTDAGMILYQKAKNMCEIEQAAQSEIASGFSGQKGMLRVGVTPSIAGGMITEVLVAFAQKYPQIEIRFLETGAGDLYKMLQNGIIEVAAVKTMGTLPENVKLLSYQDSPTVAVYRADAGLMEPTRKETISLSQLSGVPVALEELLRAPIQNAFKAKDAQLQIKSMSSSSRVPIMMANAGTAVALVSDRAAQLLKDDELTVKRIKEGDSLSARYCLLVQRGNYRSQVVNNYLRMMAEAFDLKLTEELPAPVEAEGDLL